MSLAAAADFIAAYILFPSFVWGGLVTFAGNRHGGGLSDALERVRLAVMLAPVVLGAAIVVAIRAAPWALPDPLALAPFDSLSAAAGAQAGRAPPLGGLSLDWAGLVIRSAVAVYVAGVAVLVARVALQLLTLRRIAEAGSRCGLGRGVVRTQEAVPPFASLVGTVVMPASIERQLERQHIELIIAHERAHLRRGDPAAFACFAVIDALFWVNPFVRRQTNRCRLAAELACDAAVVEAAPSMRKAYANALVLALKHAAGNARQCAPAVFSTRNLGEHRMRIAHIMSERPRSRKRVGWTAAAGLALAALPATWLQVAWAEGEGLTRFSVFPLEGRVTATYGPVEHPRTKEIVHHNGVDIAAPEGAPVRAAASGEVSYVGWDGAYGRVVEVRHAGELKTRYSHLSAWDVDVGDTVAAGRILGRVGSSGKATGAHLHWEVWREDGLIDPATMIDVPDKH